MELPDFTQSYLLNELKERMGIAADAYGAINIRVDPSRLTPLELERLTSPDGLDIGADDLRVLPDGTLSYKNSRILLYIRDVAVFGNREPEPPKYHLANCKTLSEMREKRRFNRYVVSTSADGQFRVNFIGGVQSLQEVMRLRVCQNCLAILDFKGFSIEKWPKSKRTQFVSNFSLDEFFSEYPRSLHFQLPKYNTDNAPLNDYTEDFSSVSMAAKQAAGYRCQNPLCRVDLSAQSSRKYLHVHHRNGQKSDNSSANLDVLCIRCHAATDGHGHMQSLPEYREFMARPHN